jgi:hypothetical protein
MDDEVVRSPAGTLGSVTWGCAEYEAANCERPPADYGAEELVELILKQRSAEKYRKSLMAEALALAAPALFTDH